MLRVILTGRPVPTLRLKWPITLQDSIQKNQFYWAVTVTVTVTYILSFDKVNQRHGKWMNVTAIKSVQALDHKFGLQRSSCTKQLPCQSYSYASKVADMQMPPCSP